MKNIEIWKEKRELQELFKELGFELLPKNSSYVKEKKDELIGKEEGCIFYSKLIEEIFESSNFLIKDMANSIFGYKEGQVITLYDGFLFYMTKNVNIIEEILIDKFFKQEDEYEFWRKKLTSYGIELRKHKELKPLYKKRIYLDNELDESLEICKYGKKLPPKKIKISKKEFLEWRSPRYGRKNPTKVVSKVWEYAVCSRESAYWINKKFNGPSSFDSSACWTFDRFGKSLTIMPDGREIHIAGEHEDYYDPDFYIYNDVIVVNPDDSIEFYNYPKELFPPTDFHSATLVDDKIVIIGNLSYPDFREIGKTQVLILDTNSYKINKAETKGVQPGWIHKHIAVLSEDKKSITINKGYIVYNNDEAPIENFNEWRLDLTTWQWEQLSNKQYKIFEFKREDESFNSLFKLRQALFSLEAGWKKEYQKELKNLKKELGFEPNVAMVKELYLPSDIKYRIISNETFGDEIKIEIKGTIVRYKEDIHSIIMTVEGDLDDTIIENINIQVAKKLTALEGKRYIVRELKS